MNLRYMFLGLLIAVIGIITTAKWRGHHFEQPPFEIFPDMNYQDKVKDQQPSAFFADGNSAREPVPGTVALEMPAKNDYWATGKFDDSHWGNGIRSTPRWMADAPWPSMPRTWPAAASATTSVAPFATARPATGRGS